MVHPSGDRDTEGGTDAGSTRSPARSPSIGIPRWVTVSGIIAIIVLLLGVILLLTGRGHGPGRHLSGDPAAHPPSPTVTAAGVRLC